jgi:hypothetical protein
VLKDNNVEDLTFRYGGELYQIYIQAQESYEPGKSGSQTFLRLTTFFPLSDPGKLAKLAMEYEEKPINDLLSVFVPK